MFTLPSLLGILKPPGGGPPPPSENQLILKNDNVFTVSIGIIGEPIQNVDSAGTGDIESPGTDAGGNSGIIFI